MRTEKIEQVVELLIFRSRWILAPAYLVLVGCLLALSGDTIVEFVQFLFIIFRAISETRTEGLFDETRVILQVLTIVDIVLILNLIIMVIFVGYVNFVSKIVPDKVEDWPKWIVNIDYSGLKLKLMGSIIAIASVKMLRLFVEVGDTGRVDTSKAMWMSIIYAAFLGGSFIIAVINRLEPEVKEEIPSESPDL